MNATVSIPLWLFALLLVLAVVAGLQWFLLPGVRWYFRRKVRRVLDRECAVLTRDGRRRERVGGVAWPIDLDSGWR